MTTQDKPTLTVETNHDELHRAVKVKQINNYLSKHGYTPTITDGKALSVGFFKSEAAVLRVKGIITDILDDMCENLCSSTAICCSALYNCCNCGSGNCGCAYCWSCNACSECTGSEDDDE